MTVQPRKLLDPDAPQRTIQPEPYLSLRDLRPPYPQARMPGAVPGNGCGSDDLTHYLTRPQGACPARGVKPRWTLSGLSPFPSIPQPSGRVWVSPAPTLRTEVISGSQPGSGPLVVGLLGVTPLQIKTFHNSHASAPSHASDGLEEGGSCPGALQSYLEHLHPWRSGARLRPEARGRVWGGAGPAGSH